LPVGTGLVESGLLGGGLLRLGLLLPEGLLVGEGDG
jgi:hypothetical protein